MTVVSKLFTAFLLGSRTSAAWWQFCSAECLCRVYFCLRVARARVCVRACKEKGGEGGNLQQN